MESKPIKFNPDLESEASKLYKQYCEENGIEYRITAAANFCLGYMAVKAQPSGLPPLPEPILDDDDVRAWEKDKPVMNHDNIIANQVAGMSLEEAIFQHGYLSGHDNGYERGKRETPGARWVKASEFKTTESVYRPYRRKRDDEEIEYDYGEIYVTEDTGDIFFDIDNEHSYDPQTSERWKDYEILDESTTTDYQHLTEELRQAHLSVKSLRYSLDQREEQLAEVKERAEKMEEALKAVKVKLNWIENSEEIAMINNALTSKPTP